VAELRFNTAHNPEAFICLQEVLHEQLLDIDSGLNVDEEWKHVGVGRDDGATYGEYSPIFYRPSIWKLQAFKTIWLSPTPDKPSKGWDAASIRILTIAKFRHQVSKAEIIVMNTHLDDQGKASRLESAKIISREVDFRSRQQGRPSIPVVLAGDFNSDPTMEAYIYLKENSTVTDVQTLVSAIDRYGHHNTASGFSADASRARIDYLFIKQHDRNSTGEISLDNRWEVLNYAVLENKYDDDVYSSDHRAVVADLLLH
jgi:endonuclease/exonuclease/phosphatase family metal-dependent hydrolase